MIWDKLQNQHLFMTGGTGFFGRSVLELVHERNTHQSLNLKITVLTRDKAAFLKKWSQYCDPRWISFHEGDITSFHFPAGHFDGILHFATPASATFNASHPEEMYKVIVDGTKRVLEFAAHAKIKKVLFASSGAVYGKQPTDCTHIPESHPPSPSPHLSAAAYGDGKRAAEALGTRFSKEHGFEFKIARCFAFVGPHLDPDGTYAMGNFIRDAILKQKIQTQGDGTAYRSYLYSDDLVVWLFKILLDGRSGVPYNVGSDQAITIRQLAEKIAGVVGGDVSVEIMGLSQGKPPERYVPSIELARKELGLDVFTPLDQAIKITAMRYRKLYDT